MISKFFTKSGRFIKTFFTVFVVLFFVLGPVGIKNVFATPITELFPNAQEVGGQSFVTTNVTVREKQGATSDTFTTLEVFLTGNPKATKPVDVDKNNKLNKGDQLGAWDAIFDPDDLEKDNVGIFLRISKEGGTKGTFIPVKFDTKTPVIEEANSDGTKISVVAGDVKNISGMFWLDGKSFFNDQMKLGAEIPVYNLEANTNYKVELFVIENGATLGYDTFSVEPVINIQTAVTPTGAPQSSGRSIPPENINQTFNEKPVSASRASSGDICSGVRNKEGTLSPENLYCTLIKVIVEVITFIPNLIAAMVGSLSDLVMNMSIGHSVYKTLEDTMFTGWKMVRDISNLIIIFSLFIAAFVLILGGGNDDASQDSILNKFGDPKRMVSRAIMVALFINFSFFFCRVLIDAGNVSSRFIYNQIGVKGDVGSGSGIINLAQSGQGKVKDISLAMLSQIQPQSLLIDTQPALDTYQTGSKNPLSLEHAYLATGFLVLIFDIILIYIFLLMLFLFMGRIIYLALATILSPLAFATAIMPSLENQKYIGFKNWLHDFVGNAFVGTVFFFFVYLSVLFSNISIVSDTTGFIGLIAGMLFKAAMIFGVLFYGKQIAVDMSGIVGELAVKATGYVSTFATGAAIGGSAILARQTLGAAGAGINNSSTLANAQARGGILGGVAGLLRSGGNRLGAASFDVRNSSMAMSGLNTAMNKLSRGTMPDMKTLAGDKMKNEGGFNKERRDFNVWDPKGTFQNAKGKIQDRLEEKAAKAEEARIAALKLGKDHPLTIAKERADEEAQRADRRFKNSEAALKNEENIQATTDAKAALEKAEKNEHIQSFDKVVAELNTTMNTLAANEKAMKGFTDQINKHDETIKTAEKGKVDTEKEIKDLGDKLTLGKDAFTTKKTTYSTILGSDGKPTPKVEDVYDEAAHREAEEKHKAARARKDKLDAEIAAAKAAKLTITGGYDDDGNKIEGNSKYKNLASTNKELNDKVVDLTNKKEKALEKDSDYDKANKARNTAKEKHKEATKIEKSYREDKDGDYYKGEQAVKAAQKEADLRNNAILKTENDRYQSSADSLAGNAGILSRAAETITGGNIAAGSGTMGNQGRQARRAAIDRAMRNNNNNMRG